MYYILASIIGYLIGSLPTAYIFMKKVKGLDITTHGTGNVGTLNAYEVSNSKVLGIVVLIVDVFKGLLSVYLARLLFPAEFLYPALALLFAVTAHCFSPWIKFKGGRGLATAAGGFLCLAPPVLFIWLLLWVVMQLYRRNIHYSNFLATLLTILLVLTSSNWFTKYSNPEADSELTFVIPVTLILVVIIVRHIEPIKEYFKNLKNLQRAKTNEKI